jgi:hypothetical protein
MKNSLWIGKKGLRYWYYNFRDSEYYSLTLIGLVVIVSLYLLFTIIIPETSQWFSIRREVIATRQNIATLQQNINLINVMDKNVLNEQLQTASVALPPEKNFSTMLNAITNAAAISNVTLNDYSFQVGNIASGQGQSGNSNYSDIPATVITIVVNGNIDDLRKFINTIENSVPISEVTGIDGGGENLSITLQFYQKPFPAVTFNDETPIEPLTASQVNLLHSLNKWENPASLQTTQTGNGSGSAVPVPLF